ncbi:MAG: hypothetical protein AAFY57_02575 [Cyanobacteria bacterium J06642_2]
MPSSELRAQKHCLLRICAAGGLSLSIAFFQASALALPPPEDIPEEVLRHQTILGARSPVDNQSLSPSEYEELRLELAQAQDEPPQLSPKLQQLVFLLKLRKFYRTLLPF